jgi:hypothetical protein
MNIGDLVRTTSRDASSRTCPKGLGIITSDLGSLTCGPNDIVYVMWTDTGEEHPVKIMFLELISESR